MTPSPSQESNPSGDPFLDEAFAVLSSKACPFSSLSLDLRRRLLSTMELREYGPDEQLIRQDEPGDFLLLIVSGTAEAFIRQASRDRIKVGTFSTADVVGEISPLTGEARTADVVSRTPIRALLLSVTDFHRMADAHPEVRMLLTNVVADRLGKGTYDGLGGKDMHGYRIVRCVGRGGMGIVYQAIGLRTGETVALKMLNHRLLYDVGAVHRFEREAQALQSLHHDSIARLYGSFAAYGTHFLVMEFCEGSTLKDLLQDGRSLDETIVRRIVGQLAGALNDVHRRGLIHRDLKPSNVMVTPAGVVKLLDFGLVKDDPTWSERDRAEAPTASVTVLLHGTPRYMAPEQFGHAPLDHRVDVYGLACIAYEALSGHPVVESSDLLGMVQEKLQFVLPSADEIGPGVTAEMREFLARGLESRPDRRTVDLARIATWAGPVDLDRLRNRSLVASTLRRWLHWGS
jgi:hypothetical protein